jgi:hypothetical protein
MTTTLRGTVRVTVRAEPPAAPPSPRIPHRAFGAWAEDAAELDEFLAMTRAQRGHPLRDREP